MTPTTKKRPKREFIDEWTTVGRQTAWSTNVDLTSGTVGTYEDVYKPPSGPSTKTVSNLTTTFRCGQVNEVRSGVKTRYAGIILNRGGIINTGYTRIVTTTSGGGGGRTVWYPDGSTQTGCAVNGSYTAQLEVGYVWTRNSPSVDTAKVVAHARMKALSNIDRTRFSVLEDIAEWRSALGTLSAPCRDVLKKVRKLQTRVSKFRIDGKGRVFRKVEKPGTGMYELRTSPREVAQYIGSTYLEVKFGLAQLFYTAQTVGAEIEDSQITRAKEQRTRRLLAKGKHDDSGSRSGTAPANSLNQWCYLDYTSTVSVVARAGVLYTIRDPSHFDDKSWRYGLGYKEVVPIAWNLVRLSWLVDRFLDVSNSIRAIENFLDPEVSILAGWTSTQVRTQFCRKAWSNIPRSGESKRTVDGDTATTETMSYIRSPWAPSLYDVIPPFEWESFLNSTGTAADVIALVATQLRSTTTALVKLGVNDLGFGAPRTSNPPVPAEWYRSKRSIKYRDMIGGRKSRKIRL